MTVARYRMSLSNFLFSSGWDRREDGEQAPLQESSDAHSSESSLVVGPPSSPLTHPRRSQVRSDPPREHLTTDRISSEISGGNAHPCNPNGAISVNFTLKNSKLRSSQVNFTGAVVGANGSQGKKKLVPTDGQVAKYSVEFGRVTRNIVVAVAEDEKEGLLLSIAAAMTGPDPNDSIFPGAARATTVEEFFRLGDEQKWWHWIDFERLILILEELENDCPRALEIIKQYMKKLSDCVQKRLSMLDEEHPCDEGHWIEMKCQCDPANLTLKTIKEHKQFLVNRLGLPPLAFTFCHTYDGCMVTVWRVHSEVQAAEVKKTFLSIEGCSKTEEPCRETFKVTLFTPFPGEIGSTACVVPVYSTAEVTVQMFNYPNWVGHACLK